MRNQRDEQHEAISSHLQPDGRKGRGRKIGRIRSGLSNIFERTSSKIQTPNTEPIDIYLPPPIPTKDKTQDPQSDEISTRSINETINEAKKAAQDLSTERRHARNIQRYRGFSTSISSLFLDEQVVCGAIAWCGILASSRTEHFLNIRSERRRMKKNEKFRKPSIALSMCLLVTIILFLSTFVIWGFGSGSSNDEYQDENDDYYYQRKLINYEAVNSRHHRSSPLSRINNYHAYFKEPRQLEDYSNDDQNSLTEEDMASAVR